MDRFQQRAEDDELRGREGKGRRSPRGHRGEKPDQTVQMFYSKVEIITGLWFLSFHSY